MINAYSLSSNSLNSSISAKGNVKLTRDKYSVFADEVIYDNNNKKIYLNSKTKLVDTENNNIFSDNAVISDDMSYGSFNNAGIILNNGISIISPNIVKESDDKYSLKSSNFYFCPNKDLNIDLSYDDIVKEIKKNKKQIFSLYSKKSTIDKKNEKIYLNHSIIKFFNIPIFYIPYLSTSKPFRSNISGFSSPGFSNSSKYGYSIYLPYNFYIGNNFYYSIRPRIYKNLNFLIENNLKYEDNLKFHMNFNYVYDNDISKNFLNDYNISEYSEGKYKNNRFFYGLKSKSFLSNNSFFEADINFVNDVYFLRDYYDDYNKTLKSKIDLVNIYENFHLSVKNVFFQEIRERVYSEDFERIYYVPNLDFFYKNNLYLDEGNSINFSFNTHIRKPFNDNNNLYTNIFISPEINYNFLDKFYNYFEVNTRINLDNYILPNNNDKYRINPELELKTIKPFYFNNFLFKFNIQYFLSDYNDVNIYNLDSFNSEVTVNNLFSNNRYSGYDLIEKGSRLNYGLEIDYLNKYGNFNFTIAQGYRDKIDNNHKILNFEDNVSNILSGFYYRNEKISLNYLSNINKDNYNFDRSELIFESYFNKLTFTGSYVKILKYIDDSKYYKGEEQLNLLLNYKFNRNIYTNLKMNNNLNYNKITLFDFVFGYDNDCFKLETSISKHSYIDSKNNNSISFNFRFNLKG